jgi:DDE family transposase
MEGLISCFDGLKYHRACNARRHDLLELLVIAQWTFLCGGESCVDMADFAEEKEAFLCEFLSLSGGLPSHDMFSRLFRRLDPEAFRANFVTFMRRFAEVAKGMVAVEGKTLRGGKGRELTGTTNPVQVMLIIGGDSGATSVTAHINP